VSADRTASVEPGGRAFETYVRVRFHEVDSLGHVNNAAYVNYLEQAAIDHATFLGLTIDRLRALGGVFVARRHDILFLRPAHTGDFLRIVTWLGEPQGARVERNYLVVREPDPPAVAPVAGAALRGVDPIPDDLLAVRATTEWVFASETGMPRRIPAEIVALFRADRGVERDTVS
jgi:acyl-CoA thioester hydrolase